MSTCCQNTEAALPRATPDLRALSCIHNCTPLHRGPIALLYTRVYTRVTLCAHVAWRTIIKVYRVVLVR